MPSPLLTDNKPDIARLKKIAACASVALAVALSAIKLFAALYTGSLAVLSSLVDSMADVFASVITLVAVQFSMQPANRRHRYGYGKAEALSALIQSAFIAGSGAFVLYEGIKRFIIPQPIDDSGLGLAVMGVSLLATVALIIFQRYVVKKTQSIAVQADSVHYMVDVVTNLSVIAGLAMVKFFQIYCFDTVAAVFVSGYLLFNAYGIAKNAVSMLLDKELEPQIRSRVKEIIRNCSFVCGMHDFRSRDLGGVYFFELHLELDGNLSLYEAHRLTDVVEHEIKKEFPESQVIIHQDPAGLEEHRLDDQLQE